MADQLEKAKAFARSRTAAREAEKAVPPAIQAAWVRGDFGDDHGFNTVMEFWEAQQADESGGGDGSKGDTTAALEGREGPNFANLRQGLPVAAVATGTSLGPNLNPGSLATQ